MASNLLACSSSDASSASNLNNADASAGADGGAGDAGGPVDAALTDCDGVAVDLNSSSYNCGQCGYSCEDDYGLASECSSGHCGCPHGSTLCDKNCVTTSSAPYHCGSCSDTCASPKA